MLNNETFDVLLDSLEETLLGLESLRQSIPLIHTRFNEITERILALEDSIKTIQVINGKDGVDGTRVFVGEAPNNAPKGSILITNDGEVLVNE